MNDHQTLTEKPIRLLISGGGTGGHVFPAIAIADAIKERQPQAQIKFIGANGKLEMDRVPKAGYDIEGLNIRGFQRKLSWQNLTFPFKLMGSLLKASRIVRDFRPDVVVGVGGYASGPTGEVAVRMGIPLLLQEQNGFPGVTNRLLAKRAARICVAYPDMERYFPAEKIIVTGNPVRGAIENLTATREAGLAHFGLDPERKTIFLFGGSLGARTLNDAVVASHELLRERDDVQLIWQIGKLYADEFLDSATAQLPNVHATVFVDKMEYAYAAADVIIGRAGALTISELTLVGKPAVLVPSPNVAEDHQTKNAMALVDRGAAVLVRDAEAREVLFEKTLELLADDRWREQLRYNVGKLAQRNAAARIADEIFELARASKGTTA